MTKHSLFHSAWVGLLAVVMLCTMSACSKTGIHPQSTTHQTGRAEVREAPANPSTTSTANRANLPLDVGALEQQRTEFMNGCRTSCTNKDKNPNKAAYCELYCDCTHANLRMKVPADELQAFSQGKKTTSSRTIEGIRQQCMKDAGTALSAPAQKHM